MHLPIPISNILLIEKSPIVRKLYNNSLFLRSVMFSKFYNKETWLYMIICK